MMKNYNHAMNRQERTGSVLLMILLAVAVTNVRALGIYILLAAGALFVAIKYYQLKFPAEGLSLLLFAYLFFVFSFPQYGFFSAAKILVCPLMWLVGYNMSEARSMREILRVVTVLAYGMAVHALLNYLYNIFLGTDLYSGRSKDIWTGELSAATGQAINYAMFTVISFWLIFLQEKKWLRVISVLTLLCGIMHMVQMGNRTSMILVLITYVISIFLLALYKGKLRQTIVALLAIAVIAGIFAWMYGNDAMNIRTYIENSYLFRRIGRSGELFFLLTENSRFKHKVKYLKEMPRYLWGGGNLRNSVVGFYAHDLWLDVFDDAGILPFLVLCVYTVLAFFRIFRVRKDRRITGNESMVWLSYAVGIFAQFCVEPIWQGAPLLFCSFVLIDGMLTRYLRSDTRKRLKNVS